MQATTVTHVRHLNERIQFFHQNNRDFKPRMLSVGEERCLVALCKFFVERRPFLSPAREGVILSTRSVSNETDLMTNIWFKLNQRAKYLR